MQKLSLKPLEERIKAMDTAGYNTFLLQNVDVFLGWWGRAEAGRVQPAERRIAGRGVHGHGQGMVNLQVLGLPGAPC